MSNATPEPTASADDGAALAAPAGRSGRYRGLGLGLRLAITIALLAFVIYRSSRAELVALIGWHLAPAIVMGLGLIALTLIANASRWALITRGIGAPLPYGCAIELTFIGNFFSQVLPTSVGGDVYRAWGARRQGMSLTEAVSGVLIDRLIGLTTLMLLVIAGMPFLAARIGSGVPLLIAAVVAVGLVAGPLLVVNMRRFSMVFGRFALWKSVLTLSLGTVQLAKRPAMLFGTLLLSFSVNLGGLSVMWLVAHYFGADLSLLDAIMIVPSVTFLASLPVSVGGWGVREAGLAGGFSLLGLPIETAVATSILVGLLNLLIGIPGLVPFVLSRREARNGRSG